MISFKNDSTFCFQWDFAHRRRHSTFTTGRWQLSMLCRLSLSWTYLHRRRKSHGPSKCFSLCKHKWGRNIELL